MAPRITVGADPEFFFEQNGLLKSAIDRLGGVKHAPRPLGRDGFFVLEDNVAAEFNIPPAETCEEFVNSIQWGINTIAKEVTHFGYSPSTKASALFPPNELSDPRAKVFGCDPDFNAWDMGNPNPRPHAKDERLRSCGGHIHVGWPEDCGLDRFKLIQLMDLYLGVPSVIMDEDTGRRELYGKAGSFRTRSYGAEYRTLSNFWIHNPDYTEWAYNQTIRAAHEALKFGPDSNDQYRKFMEAFDLGESIQACINESNVDMAQALVSAYNLEVV